MCSCTHAYGLTNKLFSDNLSQNDRNSNFYLLNPCNTDTWQRHMLIICWYKRYEDSRLDVAFSGIPRSILFSKLSRNSNVVCKLWNDNNASEAHIRRINRLTTKKGRKERGSRAILIHPSDQLDLIYVTVSATEGSHGLWLPKVSKKEYNMMVVIRRIEWLYTGICDTAYCW